MGYTVECEADDLRCKSEEDARKAAGIIRQDEWMHPDHLQVSPERRRDGEREEDWFLEVDHFEGDHWHEREARKVWLAIAPHMADGAKIEFRGEDLSRWRIRWHQARVFEEVVAQVTWAVTEEITAPAEEAS